MILYLCSMKYLICHCQLLWTKTENGCLPSHWKTYLILLPTGHLKSLMFLCDRIGINVLWSLLDSVSVMQLSVIVGNRTWWPRSPVLPWMHMTQNLTDHPTGSGDMWECSKLKWKQMAKKSPLCFALSFLSGMLLYVFDPNSLLRKYVSELWWNNTRKAVFNSGYSILSAYTVMGRDRQPSFFLWALISHGLLGFFSSFRSKLNSQRS